MRSLLFFANWFPLHYSGQQTKSFNITTLYVVALRDPNLPPTLGLRQSHTDAYRPPQCAARSVAEVCRNTLEWALASVWFNRRCEQPARFDIIETSGSGLLRKLFASHSLTQAMNVDIYFFAYRMAMGFSTIAFAFRRGVHK